MKIDGKNKCYSIPEYVCMYVYNVYLYIYNVYIDQST